MSRKKEKNTAKDRESTRQLMGVGFNTLDENPQAQVDTKAYISDNPVIPIAAEYYNYPLSIYNSYEGEWSGIFFDVLTEVIYALMTVLKGLAEIEMLCLNSRENFEDNKRGIRARLEREDNPAIRKLLEQDLTHLDRIQVQMATAREFLIIIRLKDEKESEVFSYLSRIEKSLKDQGFIVKRADEADIKRLLAVYFEQNVTSERFEDFDGERWIILND